MEELLLQLYFGRLSVAEVNSIVEQLWRQGNGAELLSEKIPGLTGGLDRWLTRPITEKFPYVLLHAAEIPRLKSVGETAARVAVAVGINRQGYRCLLGIHLTTTQVQDFWPLLLNPIKERGLNGPQFVVAGAGSNLSAAVEKYWTGCKLLPFESSLDEQLQREVGGDDYCSLGDLITVFKASRNFGQAKQNRAAMAAMLRAMGYYNLSERLDCMLKEHFGFFGIPRSHRLQLRKLESVCVELNRVREQVRIIGPILDHAVLARFTAARFRHVSENSWNTKPVLSFV